VDDPDMSCIPKNDCWLYPHDFKTPLDVMGISTRIQALKANGQEVCVSYPGLLLSDMQDDPDVSVPAAIQEPRSLKKVPHKIVMGESIENKNYGDVWGQPAIPRSWIRKDALAAAASVRKQGVGPRLSLPGTTSDSYDDDSRQRGDIDKVRMRVSTSGMVAPLADDHNAKRGRPKSTSYQSSSNV
jgi:hypothetical protein